MLRIQRAFLGELLLVFSLIGAITTAVVFAGITLAIVAEGQEVATQFLGDLLPSLLPIALSYSIPFAWLAASCIVLGRMKAENELTALMASGIHLRALVVPAAAVGVLLGIFGMAFNAYVVPTSQRRVKSGLKKYLPVFLNSLKGTQRSVVLGEGRISFSRYDPSDGAFLDVEIDRRAPSGGLDTKIIARRVWIRRIAVPGQEEETLEFTFADAYVTTAKEVQGVDVHYQGPVSRMQLGHMENAGASTLFNEYFGVDRMQLKPRDMTMPELIYAADRGDVAKAQGRDALEWMHRSLALGAAPFALGLFALAIALVLPPGGRRVRDFIACFLPAVILFFPLLLAGHSLARTGWPAWLAMWSSNLVLVGGALGLLAVAFRR